MTSLYNHDIILVLFLCIIKQDYKKTIWSLETEASLLKIQTTYMWYPYLPSEKISNYGLFILFETENLHF